MRWGLVEEAPEAGPATFNARAETVASTPMFRDAFQRHRCVVPAIGYYEWLKRPDGKQPYFIGAVDGGVLSFAGLWDRWKNPETGELVISCTIIVADANALTGRIHRRAAALASLVPYLLPEQIADALASARAIGDELHRARALASLAPHQAPVASERPKRSNEMGYFRKYRVTRTL